MNKILSALFCVAALFTTQSILAQDMATRARPYQNLAVWYGTQSTPAPFEKAQWALDDINAYRASKGLPELPETILDFTEAALSNSKTMQVKLTSARVVRSRIIFRRAFRHTLDDQQ